MFQTCSPGLFEDKRFQALAHNLLINNINENDKGIYVCQTTYTYMGKQYNVSRAINLITYGMCFVSTVYIWPGGLVVDSRDDVGMIIGLKLGSSVLYPHFAMKFPG